MTRRCIIHTEEESAGGIVIFCGEAQDLFSLAGMYKFLLHDKKCCIYVAIVDPEFDCTE